MATLAPSAARRFAIAAPMPREAPVTSATLLANFDMGSPVVFANESEFCGLVRRTLLGHPRLVQRSIFFGAARALLKIRCKSFPLAESEVVRSRRERR